MKYNSDFYESLSLALHKAAIGTSYDIMLVPDLLERGKGYLMTWLKDEGFRNSFSGDAMMYYYNIACIAFGGGIAYADAFEKDASQIKLGFVDTLLAGTPDITALAFDILSLDNEEKQTAYRATLDNMFSLFLQKMEPYWDKEDPRPFLFQGLMAFFQTGISLRLKNK